jgi:hypothetical protein
VEKQENEDWRDVYERLKLDESARLEKATARLRAKNGKLKEEKMAKRIIVIEPRKAALIGERRKSSPFSSMVPRKVRGITAVHASSPKKGSSLMEKARRSTSLTKLNYAGAPRFSTPRPSGSNTSGGIRPGPGGGATKYEESLHQRIIILSLEVLRQRARKYVRRIRFLVMDRVGV